MLQKYRILSISLLLFGITANAGMADDFKFAMSVKDEGKRNFYLALGGHYKTPDKTIALVKKKGLSDEEMPVLFHLSVRTGMKPEALLALRLKGKSWADITLQFGLGADIYYVPFKKAPGPPYGKAYGYFKKMPRKDWKKIKLSDSDIVHLANLKFMSEHHGFSPDEVVKIKAREKNCVSIHKMLKKQKQERTRTKNMRMQTHRKGNGSGKAKGQSDQRAKGGKKGKK